MSLIYHSLLINNPETATNSPTYAIDHSAAFDGNKYIKFSDNVDIYSDASWSIMVKSKFSADQMIIDQRISDTEGFQPIFISSDKRIQFHSTDGGSIDFDASAYLKSDNIAWNHIVMVLAHGFVSCYVNSSLVGIQPHSTSGFFDLPIYLGKRFTPTIGDRKSMFFNGTLADFRIYDHALSLPEIKRISDKLVLHYAFDEFSTSQLRDNSDFRMDALTTKCGIATDNVNIGTHCATFDGVDQHIILPDAAKLTGSMTYSIWAYMDDWKNYYQPRIDASGNDTSISMRIISCTQSGGWNIEPYIPDGDTYAYFRFAAYDAEVGAYNSLDTRWRCMDREGWVMFSMVFDADTKTLSGYIDGNLVESVDFNSNTFSYHANASLMLGAEPTYQAATPEANRFFNGRINDFRMYARALSRDEIKKLYNRSKTRVENNPVTLSSTKFTEGISLIKKREDSSVEPGTILPSILTNWSEPFDRKYDFSAKNATEVNKTSKQYYSTYPERPIKGHKYYATLLYRTSKKPTGDTRFEWWSDDNDGDNIAIGKGKIVFGKKDINTNDDWHQLSSYIEYDKEPSTNSWIVRNFFSESYYGYYCSEPIIIDLTEVFGQGHEPDKAWCDNNIRNNPISLPNGITQTGVSRLQNFVENSYLTITNSDGTTAKFLLIFSHNFEVADNMFDSVDVINCCSTNRFSRLTYLDIDSIKSVIDNKYEFLLRYPQIDGYNRWKQSKNPLDTLKADHDSHTQESMGYETISLSWNQCWGYGLCQSSLENTYTFLDCFAGAGPDHAGNFHGAIGQYIAYSGGFPAPDNNIYQNVELYIRIDNTAFNKECCLFRDSIQMNEFIEE